MTQVVFKVRADEVSLVKDLFLQRPNVRQLETRNQYEVFRVEYEDCLIIGYTTGKIVANKEEARKLMIEILHLLPGETTKPTVIGSDEAGKGEWLGPMVVAAVAVEPDQEYELIAQGVMDSKELSIPRIRELANFIRDHNYRSAHVIITPIRFNELFKELKDERKTLNDLLAWGHSKVIEDLIATLDKKAEQVRVIIDEFDKIKTEERLQRVIDLKRIKVIQTPGAEENMAVAAASIIARDLREEYVDFLCKRLHMDLRGLTVESAAADENAGEYAKLSYLSKLTGAV